MNHIEFGIQAAIIGISAVFLVLMIVSFVMIFLRKLETNLLSRYEQDSGPTASTTQRELESFDNLTDDEQFLAITAVDAYRREEFFSETESQAAIGAILEDQQSR